MVHTGSVTEEDRFGEEAWMICWGGIQQVHTTQDKKNSLLEWRIDQMMIPIGSTAYLWTVDMAIN